MNRRLRAALIVALLCIVATSVVLAQTAPNFNGRWSVFAAGGSRQSANFVVQDAFGQPAGAVSSSASSVLEGGFVVGQATSVSLNTLYLPLIQRELP